MNIARTVLTAVALVGAASSASAATNIVTNGSFELGTDPGTFQQVNPSETNITGWTVGGDSVDYKGFYWMASDGVRSVDLAGAGPGTLSQVLSTVQNMIYSLSFDISKNPDNGQVPRLGTVTVGGVVTPLSFSAANSRTDMMWETVSFSFVALSAQTLLTFAANGPSSAADGGGAQAFGLAIDNVSVVAAPEPAAWALMILGFGIVGAALRRRRTQVRFNFA